MKRVKAVLASLAVLALAGCGWNGEGVVVEKTHHDAYWYSTVVCIPSGKATVCIPQQQYAPESWGYGVRDSKGETHDVSTSREDWEAHKVGDRFDNREAGK